VEVDVAWQALPSLQVRHAAAYSYNRIRSWTQVYDVYEAGGVWAGSTSLTHNDVVPLLTPAVLVSLSGEYTPAAWCTLGAAGRYAGTTHFDNTGSRDFMAPGFFGLDANASVSLAAFLPFAAVASPRLRVQGTNLLDNRRMFPAGYSYQYFVMNGGGVMEPAGTRYYYPLATRSVSVMLDMSF
jgi:hypothetical protein